ncbi:MAG: hypothetical protein IJB94_03275, partial [Clostridia bacterium]|nr:hypothetical protein [Clostridia bacterium]
DEVTDAGHPKGENERLLQTKNGRPVVSSQSTFNIEGRAGACSRRFSYLNFCDVWSKSLSSKPRFFV